MARVVRDRSFTFDVNEDEIAIISGLDFDPEENRGYGVDFEWVLKFKHGVLSSIDVAPENPKGMITFSNALLKIAFEVRSDNPATPSMIRKILKGFGYHDASSLTWSSDGIIQARKEVSHRVYTTLESEHCRAEESGAYDSVI